MASQASHQIVAELWKRPPNATLSLDEWRYAASAAERAPAPANLRFEPVDAGGVEAEWSWLEPAPDASGPVTEPALDASGRVTEPALDASGPVTEPALDASGPVTEPALGASGPVTEPALGASGPVTAAGPVVMVFHGGGFIVCTIGTHRLLGAQVAAAAGGRSLVVGYRLAPEHPFPAPVQDCTRAYRWVLESGVAPERVVFFGDSAGGNLCCTATLLARRQGLPLPAALVLASPAPDLTFAGRSNVTKASVDPFSRIDNPPRMLDYYLQRGADPTDPLASPIFANLSGFPPMLIMLGPDETHLDDSRAIADKAADSGVDVTFEVVEGAFHTWLGYAGRLPEADESIARIGAFIRSHVA